MTDVEDTIRWVELGVIARPHGVTGELRVHVYNAQSTLLEELREVFVLAEEHEPPLLVNVVSTRRAPKSLLMRLEGVESREDAESFRGLRLAVPRDALPPLEEGEYYHADLIGLIAFAGEARVGEVVEVLDYPSVECLRVATDAGFVEVPMLPRWLDRVDIEAGRVHLKTLEDIPIQKAR